MAARLLTDSSGELTNLRSLHARSRQTKGASWLSTRGLIDKVEMLSAFRIRDVPKAVLLICIDCGATQPLAVSDMRDVLMQRVAHIGFSPGMIAFEVAGLCAACGEPREL